MKLENQVVSLELSKQLKEASYKQEGLWWWVKHWSIKKNGFIHSIMIEKEARPKSKMYEGHIVAPTVAELGEKLPKTFYTVLDGKKWVCQCETNVDTIIDIQIWANTEANARAKMWLYLKQIVTA